MSSDDFQRARSRAQKAQRREEIVAATIQLLAENPFEADLSFSEIARQVGMAKSNLYRYFESREAVLLSLLASDWDGWCRDIADQLDGLDKGSPTELARIMADATADRPRLCRLTAILPSVLERNVSEETIRDFKTDGIRRVGELAGKMIEKGPEADPQAYVHVLRQAIALIMGLWALANPSELAANVVETPGFETFRYDFREDLRVGLELLFQGALGQGARGGL
ncbi:MAG: TetR family transcriptional regulator [Myxococcales bacterium]|nr:TetR family transcriptional regulator [Myxococcales bacterium]